MWDDKPNHVWFQDDQNADNIASRRKRENGESYGYKCRTCEEPKWGLDDGINTTGDFFALVLSIIAEHVLLFMARKLGWFGNILCCV